MSLKAFHIVFVTTAVVLCVGFGIWAIRKYQTHGDTLSVVAGIGSLVGAVVLVLYGRWFLRKLKGVGLL